jgi:hypothetical protein
VITGQYQTTIIASDAALSDFFGGNVDIDGDTAIVGAPNRNVPGTRSGAAFIYVKSGGVWSLQTELTPSEIIEYNYFGSAVAIYGDMAIVGAHGRSTNVGTAYIFERTGTTWSLFLELVPHGLPLGAHFSYSVALNEDHAVFGTYGIDTRAGAVYVYTKTGTDWTQMVENIVRPNVVQAESNFGLYVALDNHTLVVTAPGEEVGGVDNIGAAYVFEYQNDVWTQQSRLIISGMLAGEGYGYSVAVHNDIVCVGAHKRFAGAESAGTMYIFTRTNSNWALTQKLTDPNPTINGLYGWSVVLNDDVMVVSSGDENVAGQLHFLTYNNTLSKWREESTVTRDDKNDNDYFGYAQAITPSGELLVGAPQDQVNSVNTGLLYVYDVVDVIVDPVPPPPIPYDPTCPKIVAGDLVPYDDFGNTVKLFQNTAVISKPRQSSTISPPGRAYIYNKINGSWALQLVAASTSDDHVNNQHFGDTSLATNGGLVFVGSAWDDTQGVTGGKVYIFANIGTPTAPEWVLQKSLYCPNTSTSYGFGYSLDAVGNELIVGAPYVDSGRAYVFDGSTELWRDTAILLPDPTPVSGAQFGSTIATDGDTLVVGAIKETIGGVVSVGAIYVFRKGIPPVGVGGGSGDPEWLQVARFEPTTNVDVSYARDIHVLGNVMLVSAIKDASTFLDAGAVYVYEFVEPSGGGDRVWEFQTKLTADDAGSAQYFGTGLAVRNDDEILIGAFRADDDDGGFWTTGAVYKFVKTNGSWVQHSKRVACDNTSNNGNRYGSSISIYGTEMLVGAPNNSIVAEKAGAAYVINLDAPTEPPPPIGSPQIGSPPVVDEKQCLKSVINNVNAPFLELKDNFEEWQLFREHQPYHIRRDMWDAITEAIVGYKLKDLTIRVPTLDRELYDERFKTSTRYGLGEGQSFTNGEMAKETILADLENPNQSFYPIDIISYFQRNNFDTKENTIKAMDDLYNLFSYEHVNRIYFSVLMDAFSLQTEFREIFKTSMLSLYGVRPFQIAGLFDD